MKHLFYYLKKLKNNGFELEFIKHDNIYLSGLDISFQMLNENNYILSYINFFNLMKFHFQWNHHKTHAGIYFDLQFFNFNLILNLYDYRHWDNINNKWC